MELQIRLVQEFHPPLPHLQPQERLRSFPLASDKALSEIGIAYQNVHHLTLTGYAKWENFYRQTVILAAHGDPLRHGGWLLRPNSLFFPPTTLHVA